MPRTTWRKVVSVAHAIVVMLIWPDDRKLETGDITSSSGTCSEAGDYKVVYGVILIKRTDDAEDYKNSYRAINVSLWHNQIKVRNVIYGGS